MNSIAIILIIIGVLLLIAEIFIPSFGVTGITGIISILIGVILTSDTFVGGLLLFTGILVVAVILMFIAYKLLSTVKSPFVLKESLNEDKDDLSFFVGKTGVAITPLRPAGTAELDGVRIDVVTRGDFIEKGTSIRVESVQGTKIVVKSNV
jgi:membrane-bound ClpP family serine protease